jgi:hypothetical protein
LSVTYWVNLQVEFRKAERDKYFRINAWVIADGKNVSAVLILNVFAVPYDGGTKTKDWCAETTVEPQAILESLPFTPLRERQSEPGVAVIFYPRSKRERESRRTLLVIICHLHRFKQTDRLGGWAASLQCPRF